MKSLMILAVIMCVSGAIMAGDMKAPNPPSGGSGMYTLQNLYDYLTSGTELSTSSSFREPGADPGSTMKSTKELGDGVKALFDQCDAGPEDVQSGMKFFCTKAGQWGVKEGTYELSNP